MSAPGQVIGHRGGLPVIAAIRERNEPRLLVHPCALCGGRLHHGLEDTQMFECPRRPEGYWLSVSEGQRIDLG